MGFILVNLKINFFVSFSSSKYDSDSGAFNVLDLVIRVNSSFFSTIFKGFRINLRFRWCYGNTSKWKRFNTEMPQKKTETPQKPFFFETFPQFLQEKRKSLKTQFLRGFLFILRHFLKFLRGFRFSPDYF